jgi:hypothetical protein
VTPPSASFSPCRRLSIFIPITKWCPIRPQFQFGQLHDGAGSSLGEVVDQALLVVAAFLDDDAGVVADAVVAGAGAVGFVENACRVDPVVDAGGGFIDSHASAGVDDEPPLVFPIEGEGGFLSPIRSGLVGVGPVFQVGALADIGVRAVGFVFIDHVPRVADAVDGGVDHAIGGELGGGEIFPGDAVGAGEVEDVSLSGPVGVDAVDLNDPHVNGIALPEEAWGPPRDAGLGAVALGGQRIGKIVIALGGAEVGPVDSIGGSRDGDGAAVDPIDAGGIFQRAAALGVIHEPLRFLRIPDHKRITGGMKDRIIKQRRGGMGDVDERGIGWGGGLGWKPGWDQKTEENNYGDQVRYFRDTSGAWLSGGMHQLILPGRDGGRRIGASFGQAGNSRCGRERARVIT